VYPDPDPVLGYEGKLMCGTYTPTNVISISYGEQEDDLPTNYQQRQCNEMMKLGMQGVSIILASGHSGVAARSTDDGNADGCLGTGEVFNPDFPASCPYLTAVGATYLPTGGSAAKDEEVAVTRFPSGGGFSNIYPAPDYQKSTLSTYFSVHDPGYKYYNTSGMNNPPESVTNGGIYNRGGRGYPDVSAVGDNVVIILDGMPTLIGGTSASAPVFGAILNRINEERIAAGKSTVGFVNPTLVSLFSFGFGFAGEREGGLC
jgi:tripeptidyl-peptidase-1